MLPAQPLEYDRRASALRGTLRSLKGEFSQVRHGVWRSLVAHSLWEWDLEIHRPQAPDLQKLFLITLMIMEERVSELVDFWQVHLQAQGVSDRTQDIYLGCIQTLLGDRDPVTVRTRHLEAALAELREQGQSPSYVHQHYRVAKTFFKWLVAEEEIDRSPVDRLKAPIVPPKMTPVLQDGDLQKMLDRCKGRDLMSRRDNALLRFLADTGCRREEVASLLRDDVDLKAKAAVVLGKGRKPRAVYFSSKTSEALGRYLRVRKDDYPELWIGRRGPLLPRAIHGIVKRRGEQVGIPGLFPHMMRHTFASSFLEQGGSEGDLMRLAGWSTREMLDRYGAAVADTRAQKAYRRVFGD